MRAETAFPVPKSYLCVRTEQPLSIDGSLDDPAWKLADWTDDFVDIEGDTKPEPKLRTRAKMLWDDRYLYVAAELEEPHVWATLKERDSVIFQDNDFEVFIDPDGDNHEYFEFEMNAIGTCWDLLLTKPYKDGGSAVNGWDVKGIKVAAKVNGTINDPSDTDTGWTLEIAFPWVALGECARKSVPPVEGDQWRINFSRVEWDLTVEDGAYRKVEGRLEHNWVWSPQGVIDMHRPERWGIVQFTSKPKGEARLEPDHSLAAREALHRIYYAQVAFRERHGRWGDLSELDLVQVRHETLVGEVVLERTQSLFEARVPVAYPDGRKLTWHISQDSRIWSD